MKYRPLVFIAIILILAAVNGCRTIRPEKPGESYGIIQYIMKPSVINIPVNINIRDMEDLLNNKVNGLIYEDNSLEDNGGDNLMVKAWKKDRITIAYNNYQLAYKVPLKLWIKAGFRISKFGLEVSDYREINAEIALKYRTTFLLNKDWSVSSKTYSDGYEWISAPVMKVGPVDLNIKIIADLILKSNKDKITSAIDKGIKDYLNIRKYVSDAWQMVQKPYKVNDEYGIWLKITPESIMTLPLSGSGDQAVMTLGVKGITELHIGSMPDTTVNRVLPPLSIVNKMDKEFLVNANIRVPFTTINEMTKKELKGKTFSSGKQSVLINDINIYGSDGYFVVDLNLLGSVKGNIYLKGSPYFDDSLKTIRVRDLDFDLKTKNVLLKSASWLLHNNLLKMIGPKLSYSVEKEYNEAKITAGQALSNYIITDGVTLKGTLDDIKVDTMYINREAANVIISINGTVKIDMGKPVK